MWFFDHEYEPSSVRPVACCRACLVCPLIVHVRYLRSGLIEWVPYHCGTG